MKSREAIRQSQECLALENVQAQVKAAAIFAGNIVREELESDANNMGVNCFYINSPIEMIFFVWWHAIRRAWNSHYSPECDLLLQPQVEVEANYTRYRLDFQIIPNDIAGDEARAVRLGLAFPKLAVELDGHDFHERTKEQVTIRDKRDRDLQISGWKVFHFSGSELHRQAEHVVNEIFLEAARLNCQYQADYRYRLNAVVLA